MEILVLILLYYVSQNPDFEKTVKPLLSELKNSEAALKFLEELSSFSKLFSSFNNKNDGGRSSTNENSKASHEEGKKEERGKSEETKKQSPTSGIADSFIEDLLSKYFHSTA